MWDDVVNMVRLGNVWSNENGCIECARERGSTSILFGGSCVTDIMSWWGYVR